MIRSLDVMLHASRSGLVLQHSIVREALRQVDREALEQEERGHWQAVMWDGQGEPPIGTRDRWLHGEDAISRAAIEAFGSGHQCVYFLLRDGQLVFWQPFRAYERGHFKLERDDEGHPHHWQKASDDHIAVEVEREVDGQVLAAALETALDLHEQRSVPVGVAPLQQSGRP